MSPKKTAKDYRDAANRRQKAWRQGLVEQGYKFLSVPMSPEAQNIIAKERELTGETVGAVLERALQSVTHNVTNKQNKNIDPNVTTDTITNGKKKPLVTDEIDNATISLPGFDTGKGSKKKSLPLKEATDDKQRKEIRDRIKEMKVGGMSPYAIAKQLNSEGILPVSGKGKWYDSTVKRLLGAEPETKEPA